eukprot:742405_1
MASDDIRGLPAAAADRMTAEHVQVDRRIYPIASALQKFRELPIPATNGVHRSPFLPHDTYVERRLPEINRKLRKNDKERRRRLDLNHKYETLERVLYGVAKERHEKILILQDAIVRIRYLSEKVAELETGTEGANNATNVKPEPLTVFAEPKSPPVDVGASQGLVNRLQNDNLRLKLEAETLKSQLAALKSQKYPPPSVQECRNLRDHLLRTACSVDRFLKQSESFEREADEDNYYDVSGSSGSASPDIKPLPASARLPVPMPVPSPHAVSPPIGVDILTAVADLARADWPGSGYRRSGYGPESAGLSVKRRRVNL